MFSSPCLLSRLAGVAVVAGGTEEVVCAGQGPPWLKEHPGWGHLPGPWPEKVSLLVLLGWVGVRELLCWLRWFGGGRKRMAEARGAWVLSMGTRLQTVLSRLFLMLWFHSC